MNVSSRIAGATFAGALCLLATPALAQSERHDSFESPQHFAIELRGGIYRPRIDSEFAGQTVDLDRDPSTENEPVEPFRTAFGKKIRFTIGAELDWQAYRIPYVGTIGPGVGISYTKFGAKAFKAGTTDPSEEDTSLSIFPMAALAVLRVDVLSREVGIPIVPYLKAGLGVGVWHMTNGSGTSKIETADAKPVTVKNGRGIAYGPQWAIGGMLLLDWLDEYAARQADQTLGVNNTYLFAEFTSSRLNNVRGTALQIGADAFNFGLAFEF